MQDTGVIIQDDYINEMADYYERQGKQLQCMIDAYMAAMRRVAGEGITIGRTSDALKSFLEYAQKLNQAIATAAMGSRDSAMRYLEEIAEQEQYRL